MSDEQQTPGDVSQSSRNSLSFTFILFLVLVGLGVVFFLQNSETVPLDFLVFEKVTTIRWSLLMAVVLGILIDRIFAIWWRRRRRKYNP